MASVDLGTALQPNGGLDLPLALKDEDARDLTWNADDIENWSSSTDDDEESVGEPQELPALRPRNDSAPAVTGVQSGQTNGPKLSLFPSIVQSQRQWTEKIMGHEMFGPHRSQSSDSDSSLVSIPAIVPRLKETPVPLPSTVGMTVTRGGASSTQFAGEPERVTFPSTAPPAPTTELSVKPTPVPLPSFMRASVPASQPNGQQASDTTWPNSKMSRNKPEEVIVDWASDKTLSAASQQVILAAMSRPGVKGAVMFATDGRPYTVFRKHDGEMVSAIGALIPADYKLHDDPVYPFICPVRDCRRTLRTLASLKGHFGASHKTITFNDNRDGTLTRVGRYKSHIGRSPAIVVSQNPLPDDARPPVPPRMTDFEQKWASFPGKRGLDEPNVPDNQKYRILSGERPTTDTLGYLLTIYDEKTMPWRPDIAKMTSLPAKRTLPRAFMNHHQGTLEDAQILACAAAYITGDEVPSSLACRAAKGPLARLSERCIVLRTTLQLNKKELAMFIPRYMCVGCAYLAHVTAQPDLCALRPENFLVHTNDIRLGAAPPAVRPLPSNLSSRPAVPRVLDSPASSARGSPVGAMQQTLATQRPARQSVLNRLTMDKENFEAPTRTSTKSPASQPSIQQPPKPAPKHAAVQAEQLAAEDYEMDDWEIAPGRVTSDDLSQNLAYSGPFLSSSTPVAISPDICFNVLTIRPGQIFHVSVHKDKIQVFSVASGKVKVTTGGKVVQMGPNGAFPVRPGDTCVIENRNYGVAMVHCTTVKDYELV